MTLTKFSRAGLLVLAAAIVLGIALSLPTFHASYAQTPAAPGVLALRALLPALRAFVRTMARGTSRYSRRYRAATRTSAPQAPHRKIS